MFERNDKDDVCYCETCKHKTAKDCIELRCTCCKEADKIRLEHIIVPEDDLSKAEESQREAEEHQEGEREREMIFSQIDVL